jgi:hypothetical protein
VKPKFRAGDWFTVPLVDGTWAVGRIGRRNGPVLLGYFFGPRRPHLPSLEDVESLRAENADWVHTFGYLGLREGEWPILGGSDDFDPTAWPMPMFGMHDLRGEYWGIYYPEDKPNTNFCRKPITAEEFASLPKLGTAGDRFVCEWLDSILPPLEAAPNKTDSQEAKESPSSKALPRHKRRG